IVLKPSSQMPYRFEGSANSGNRGRWRASDGPSESATGGNHGSYGIASNRRVQRAANTIAAPTTVAMLKVRKVAYSAAREPTNQFERSRRSVGGVVLHGSRRPKT